MLLYRNPSREACCGTRGQQRVARPDRADAQGHVQDDVQPGERRGVAEQQQRIQRKGGKGGEASAYSDFEKEYQFCVEVLIFCGGKGDYAYNECTEYVYYKCIYRKRVGIFY